MAAKLVTFRQKTRQSGAQSWHLYNMYRHKWIYICRGKCFFAQCVLFIIEFEAFIKFLRSSYHPRHGVKSMEPRPCSADGSTLSPILSSSYRRPYVSMLSLTACMLLVIGVLCGNCRVMVIMGTFLCIRSEQAEKLISSRFLIASSPNRWRARGVKQVSYIGDFYCT